MPAGGSQAVSAVSAALVGAARAKSMARHRAGCRGERAVCAELSKLAAEGVGHRDDLRWHGDPECLVNVDHLVVGPTGVFVVDAKNWGGSVTVRGNSMLHRGQAVDDRLIALSWVLRRVAETLRAAGFAHRPQALVCFTGSRPDLPPAVADVLVTDESRLSARIADRPQVLSAMQVQAMTDSLARAFPPYQADEREAAEAAGLLFNEVETRHSGMREALDGPLERWMVWLHPEQAALVRRSVAGPARIRGSAGTGKSSVALHRVAWLAQTRPGRFLVTSHVRTVPQVLAPSYARLAPGSADRVDFVHLHRVALDVLGERGITVRPTDGSRAFAMAWQAHRHELAHAGLTCGYFREEVDAVVKGRGLTRLEDYLSLERVGRGTPLQLAQRRVVWSLRENYDAELRTDGQHDFVDVLRLARDEVRREPYQRWTGVVVDEVQDLTLVGLQLAHELAGRDRPDALLLLGDGQQAVYPGGFRLAEAGISVAGRSMVLRTNYRNTVEILQAAAAVVHGDAFDDLDAAAAASQRDTEVVRHGPRPTISEHDSPADHDAALLWDMQALADSGVPWTCMAVLCPTNAVAATYSRELRDHGVPAALLSERTTADGAVQVGTWCRSKGLEWPHVFLPQSNRRIAGAGTAAQEEKAALARRTLFVAMTRARDTLWIGKIN